MRQYVDLKRSIRIWDFRSERPRESVNRSAPNKFIWESLRRTEHFSSMQKMSQNGQAETVKFGEVSKMEKGEGGTFSK